MSASDHINVSGRASITGTDIKISQIASEHEHQGMTPDEIVDAHSHLSLGAVHAALAYYYDHQDAIRREWNEDRELVESLRAQYERKASA